MSDIPKAIREAVRERAGWHCEAGGMTIYEGEGHIHHRRLQSQGGPHTLENLIYVHLRCHESIHKNRDRSRFLGHIVETGDDPALVRVQILPGLCVLR